MPLPQLVPYWVDEILSNDLPSLPQPFTWLSNWVNERLWWSVRRTWSEQKHGFELIGTVLWDVWGHRAWYVNRLSIRIKQAANIAILQSSLSIQSFSLSFNARLAAVSRYIAEFLEPLVTAASNAASTAAAAFASFLLNTFTPWRDLVESFRLWGKARLDELAAWSVDLVNYWRAIYNGYRVTLAAFLPNPLLYILASLETDLGRWAEWLRERATTVLDLVW